MPRLASGYEMPMSGFGTARLKNLELRNAIKVAIDCGVRMIDTAKLYGNEEVIGEELEKLMSLQPSSSVINDDNEQNQNVNVNEKPIITREELFICTKLWNDDHHPDHVEQACRDSLKRLRLDYIDLYLIHWPLSWKKGTVFCPDESVTIQDTWKAMEKLVEKGLVRSIGVSNFGIEELEQVLEIAKIPCSVNQLELHPMLQQDELVQYCNRKSIFCVAWSPLAKYHKNVIEHPVIRDIAVKHGCTPVKVVLRWNVERGVGVIPRSKSAKHIRENLAIVDAKLIEHHQEPLILDSEDMEAIKSVDQNRRLFPDIIGVFHGAPLWAKFLGRTVSIIAKIVFAIFPNRVDLGFPLRR